MQNPNNFIIMVMNNTLLKKQGKLESGYLKKLDKYLAFV
ncbi:Uncharacterized protein dnl_11940 [Desulfonema limicola]|uniref:Uncharacterized protein n=1 Tax=Desulfonema limicola TaxID=45656 RepID=A0A975B530_9BACT|nr:Uncharacterized protein dnl_11940 [Desulfonema limicola]